MAHVVEIPDHVPSSSVAEAQWWWYKRCCTVHISYRSMLAVERCSPTPVAGDFAPLGVVPGYVACVPPVPDPVDQLCKQR